MTNDFSGVAANVVQAGSIRTLTIQAAPTLRPPGQLPAAVVGFTDRDDCVAELDRLLAAITESSPSSVVVAAIGGTAGVGKTALALHWAHRVRGDFPDGQLYADLQGHGPHTPANPNSVLGGFLTALGMPPASQPDEVDPRAACFRGLIDGKRLLVVLDNVGSVDQVRPLLPGSASCFVIVTSRDALNGLVAREGAARIGVSPLPAGHAAELFSAIVGQRAAEDAASVAEIVELCERLPLTIRIAAELANSESGTPLADLADELRGEQDRLDAFEAGDDIQSCIRAVFSWSYHHLSTDAARAFRLIGLHPERELGAGAVIALSGLSGASARRAVRELCRAHLLEEPVAGRHRMHDLLRLYAAELAIDEETPESRSHALHRLVEYYAAEAGNNAHAWFEIERTTLCSVVDLAADQWPGPTIRISKPFGRFLRSRSYFSDAIRVHERGRSAAKAVGDLACEAEQLRGLAAASRHLGDSRAAIEHYRSALSIHRALGDRGAEADALDHLGISHRRLGEYEVALDCHEQAMAMGEALGDHAQVGRAQNNLGIVHRRRGEYAKALDAHQKAFAAALAAGDRTAQTRARTSSGIVCRRLGLHDQALTHHQRALSLNREMGNKAGEARELIRLGMVLEQLHRWPEAHEHFGKSAELARSAGNLAELGRALTYLGVSHRKSGNPDRALEVLHEAHAALSRTRHRADLAHAEGAIGMAHLEAGELDAAAEWLERCREGHLSCGNEVDAAKCANDLGKLHASRGDLTAARNLHSAALAVGEHRGNHELRLTSLRLLAATARAAGNRGEALSRLEEAMGCALGTNSQALAFEAHRDLADFHQAEGADQAAREHLRAALAIAERAALPESDEVRAALARMATGQA
ncbi:ATP-binding protein [Actinokineospora sp. 24-640]